MQDWQTCTSAYVTSELLCTWLRSITIRLASLTSWKLVLFKATWWRANKLWRRARYPLASIPWPLWLSILSSSISVMENKWLVHMILPSIFLQRQLAGEARTPSAPTAISCTLFTSSIYLLPLAMFTDGRGWIFSKYSFKYALIKATCQRARRPQSRAIPVKIGRALSTSSLAVAIFLLHLSPPSSYSWDFTA